MEEKAFVQAVSERTGLTGRESADLHACHARDARPSAELGEARNLALELPEGLAESVRRGATREIERFDYDELVRRVAQRNVLKPDEADGGVRAVLVTLRDAIARRSSATRCRN